MIILTLEELLVSVLYLKILDSEHVFSCQISLNSSFLKEGSTYLQLIANYSRLDWINDSHIDLQADM